ncbi:MAG: hypothetical protein MUQ32_13880, partial [Chloroflexi bacterium]|nr:hypothetical protein [Chloroflexota bacterium]
MIVEPTPTNPRSPVRRALSLAGLALPVALLVAIVGAGAAGPKPEPESVAPDASHRAVAEEPSAFPAPAASPTAPATVTAPTGPGPGFPTGAAGLPVHSVPEAQGLLATGDGLPIAVAGFLEGLRADDTCAAATGDTRGPLSPLCDRRARLVMIGDFGWRSGVHLHLRFPPGVRLPAVFEDASPDGPIPVVIV